jgi:hypothetical protein
MRALALFMLLIGASGCASYNMANIHQGMSRRALVWEAGNPDAYMNGGTFERFVYFNRYSSTYGRTRRADYYIFLKDDRVIEYGVAQVYN